MNNIKTVDVRGLSCPQPAMQTAQILRGLTSGTVEVMVDCGTARDNVSRVAQRAGWRVTVEALPDGGYKLVLNK